jgi:hypothetical protein
MTQPGIVIETLSAPFPQCRGCGKPITQRPFIYVQVKRYLPRDGHQGGYTQSVESGDYHEACWKLSI